MKILVAVKRVIDYNVQIRVKDDNSGIVTENVKMSTNPPDDNAIEEAVKIKEAGKATEIVAITIGDDRWYIPTIWLEGGTFVHEFHAQTHKKTSDE